MTRTILVIGIGAGDPEHLSLQAVAAMNRVDVFFTIDKGAVDGGATAELAALRKHLLDRHVTRPYRVVTAPEVPRDRDPVAYVDTAVQWQARRAALYERMITSGLADGETGGFLVWGDPSLYDGTLNLSYAAFFLFRSMRAVLGDRISTTSRGGSVNFAPPIWSMRTTTRSGSNSVCGLSMTAGSGTTQRSSGQASASVRSRRIATNW